MSSKKIQKTKQIGWKNESKTIINKSTTIIKQTIPEGHIILEEKVYKKSLKDAVEVKELKMKIAHGKEKEILRKEIDDLKTLLANLPESLKKATAYIAKLEKDIKREGNEIGAEKLKEAIEALKQADFSKADKLYADIEDHDKLAVERASRSAFARGGIAEQEIRLIDAAKHFARAAHLNPCFATLVQAQVFALYTDDYDSGLFFSSAAQKTAIAEYGENSKEHGTSINNLAEIYSAQGKYEKAEPLLVQALEIAIKLFGEKNPSVAASYNNIAGLYYAQGQYEKAKPFNKKALAIHNEVVGENHVLTSTSLNNLAEIYREQEKYNKAIPLYRKSIKICIKHLGAKHPETATCFNNLGLVYDSQGNYKKAKELFNKALNIRIKVFGENNPHTATTINNIGGLYFARKNYKKAEPLFLRALKIFESTLGHEHPRTIGIRLNHTLAMAYS